MGKKTRGTDNRVLRVCRLLNRHRARYPIAGGVAANLHGSVRSTKDVDILVAWTVSFAQAWPHRRIRRIDGVRVPFLSLRDLKKSKQTGRDRVEISGFRHGPWRGGDAWG